VNDEIKEAVAWLRARNLIFTNRLAKYIDDEPARQAAAVAAAKEEQREACAQALEAFINERLSRAEVAQMQACANIVRQTPLTSEPLKARIAELEAEAAIEDDFDALRAERDKLKQERDSFKAVYEAAKQQVRDEIQRASETADRICKERDAYRAECEALRARVAEFERLQQVWLMSPEAAKRLDAYRELAQKCAQLEARVAALEGGK
jgi:chromosome condensin MukBEF ATPase and DNA-binding subunit MukB